VPNLPIWILLSVAVAYTSACVPTRVVEVRVPVVVTPPPCLKKEPPVPAETMTDADQVIYEENLTGYAWSAFCACGPPEHPLVKRCRERGAP
jgi:hypothetical protein